MKVLMIAPQPFLEPRGTPISVHQRVSGLASLGHSIDLLTYHLGQNVDIAGVTIHRIPRVPFVRMVPVGPSWYKPFLDLLLLLRALQLLISRKYDVIHSHEEAAFFAAGLAKLFRIPHLYDMHSSLPRQLANSAMGKYRPLVSLFEVLERRTLATADAVITIAADLEQQARLIAPHVPQVMIENLPVQATVAPIDPAAVEQLRQQLGLKDRPAIVYTGTLERYQGIDLLLESVPLVCRDYPEVCFVLVGGKPAQIDHWQNEARRKHVDHQVRFVGTVPMDEVSAYVGLADMLVSPRTEGMSVPLKIYSYLYAGKPIVATDLLAHTMVLNDETALLVPATPAGVADGIMALIRDPERRQQLGDRGQRYASARFNRDRYIANLEHIYAGFKAAPAALELT